MGSYKVPQDVEADDKLLGPFSFRQFVYLLICVMAGGMGWVLWQIFPLLIIIVIPVIAFFGVLALPLKKDQPMETYVGALVSFYLLKPRKRFWQPDGLDSLVEITAPKEVGTQLAKDISQREAKARIGYLSEIVESDGWAVRGIGVPTQGVANYAQEEDDSDLLGEDNASAHRFDQMLDNQEQSTLSQARDAFQQQMAQPAPTPQPAQQARPQQQPHENSATIQYNPYPQIRQSVVQPLGERPQADPAQLTQRQSTTSLDMPTRPPQNTSINEPSPDIIKLANESGDISIATVAEQAHRLTESHGLPEDEVEISLH